MGTPRAQATLEIDGSAVFYETEGDGDAIVLLHGGMADNSTWYAQFSGLSPHRRVVAPERQAQGHTPDRPGPLTYEGMADQTVSLLGALGLGPVDLLGWSDGGMVGTLIAAEHPELVRTLTVTGSGFSSTGYVPGAMEELVSLAPDDGDMVMFAAMYARASPDGPDHFPEVWEKVRALWMSPLTGLRTYSGSRHRPSSSSATTTLSAWTTHRSSPARSGTGSWPGSRVHRTSSPWRNRTSSTSWCPISRPTPFPRR